MCLYYVLSSEGLKVVYEELAALCACVERVVLDGNHENGAIVTEAVEECWLWGWQNILAFTGKVIAIFEFGLRRLRRLTVEVCLEGNTKTRGRRCH